MKKHPVKAYKNLNFLLSSEARTIRVLCELIEPQTRLRKYNIENTIVFFGSARAIPGDIAEKAFSKIEKSYKNKKKHDKKLVKAYEDAKADLHMSQYYEKARKLAFKLGEWSKKEAPKKNHLVLCTGGGGGIMEAANRGAYEAGADNLGFNISLPFEQKINEFVTNELSFEFHYFFIRKFWFAYLAKALIIFPGGFGTFDEMMEILTLVQTKKINKEMPIIVFGREYWNNVLNFDAMVKFKTINSEDLKLFNFFDDVDEAFEFLKKKLKKYVN